MARGWRTMGSHREFKAEESVIMNLGVSEITVVAVWGVGCQETRMDVGRPASRLFQKREQSRTGSRWKWQRWRE